MKKDVFTMKWSNLMAKNRKKKKSFIGSTPAEGKIQNDDQSQLVQIEKQVAIFLCFLHR